MGAVRVAAQAPARGRGGDGRLRPRARRRTRSCGPSRASSTTSTTSASRTWTTRRTGTRAPPLRLFAELGWPQEVIDAVAGHATFLGVPRETDMAKTLFAVDELSGFIAACALVRPTGIEGMAPKSVKKKLKQPSFAAGVNRDEVREGAEELGVDFDEHIAFVIAAMEARARGARAPRRGSLEPRPEDPDRDPDRDRGLCSSSTRSSSTVRRRTPR